MTIQTKIANAVKLVRELMEKYYITQTNVIRHYDVTGKNCPAPMVSNPTLWATFKKEIDEMTQQDFDKMMNNWMQRNNPLYQAIADMPGYLQPEAQELVNASALKGDGKGLDVRHDQLRTLIIGKRYADRRAK